MRQQRIPDGTIACAEAGRGAPVVLLHAFPLNHAMWRAQIAALQGEFRVLAPDLRGFGGTSPFQETPSLARMADDIAQLLDALGVSEPVTLGGLSLGGYVALNFAHRHPQRLRALILADTRAEADGEQAKTNRAALIEFAQNHTMAEFADKVLPDLLAESTRQNRPEVLAELKAIAAANSPDGIVTALQAMRDRPDATAWLPKIAIPSLLVFGEKDALAPSHVLATLQNGLPNARLKTIPEAGHLSNLEAPEAFNEILLEFLRAREQ